MARSVMIAGTMSSVGKSVIAAALCRIFARRGFRTVPFKSQNMSNNSFVTKDGCEMGRAQVLQAVAAGTEPDARMNPILLKPDSDSGSQVILNGRVYGNYSAGDYYKIKASLIPQIKNAYDSLAEENDIIVIEGAGSCAEINLKQDDIVNLGLARMVDAPVLLVGDIDPGGVFAQIYGTMELLESDERELIRGIIINKFRGDISLLEPGIEQLLALTKRPVIGVVPYMHHNLDDEDSMSLDRAQASPDHGRISICIIRLPHISNFTDFAVLEHNEDVSVYYAGSIYDIKKADMIILPGTKNTTADLRWLYETGLSDLIIAYAKNDVPILGVCGGYQILGKEIRENDKAFKAMGLLDIATEMSDKKTTLQQEAVCCGAFEGAKIKGYQIHMGVTSSNENRPFAILCSGEYEGAQRDNVFGTYIHGLFDSGELLSAMSEAYSWDIANSKEKMTTRSGQLDRELDKLADTVEEAIDISILYEIMGL